MIETQQGLTRQSKASDKRETEITKKNPLKQNHSGAQRAFFQI